MVGSQQCRTVRVVGEFADLTMSRVPAGIDVPEPLRMLFEWVDSNGFVERGEDGELYGALSSLGQAQPVQRCGPSSAGLG